MGDKNQLTYFQTHKLQDVEGPILEVGSATSNHALPYKKLCDTNGSLLNDYIGVDIEEGPGVDVVQDLCEGPGQLAEDYFRLVICSSVLEHVKHPWLMADTITQVTRSGGFLYLSVPWVWRFHAYPDDYFRYSPASFDALFPNFQWGNWAISGRKEGNIKPLDMNNLPGFDCQWTEHGVLPFMMINAIGVKK